MDLFQSQSHDSEINECVQSTLLWHETGKAVINGVLYKCPSTEFQLAAMI